MFWRLFCSAALKKNRGGFSSEAGVVPAARSFEAGWDGEVTKILTKEFILFCVSFMESSKLVVKAKLVRSQLLTKNLGKGSHTQGKFVRC